MLSNEKIILDFDKTKWFDGNLCAVLGVINTGLEKRGNDVTIANVPDIIKHVFNENEFIPNEECRNKNIWLTNRYSANLNPTQEKAFADYVGKLLDMPLLPDMSELLRKKINRSVLEIFNNAVNHGMSETISTCGQYFPKSQKLVFSICDLGHTIRKNVREYQKNKISAKQAIEWAVHKGNTTRTGNIPGGLGFSLIRDFLTLNGGSIEVVSSNGFWQEKNGATFADEFKHAFVGTIVSLEFNLNDTKSYILAEEIGDKPLF